MNPLIFLIGHKNDVAKLITSKLEDLNCRVKVYGNCCDATRGMSTFTPDVVICEKSADKNIIEEMNFLHLQKSLEGLLVPIIFISSNDKKFGMNLLVEVNNKMIHDTTGTIFLAKIRSALNKIKANSY